jgi:3-dehydroquinate synthase
LRGLAEFREHLGGQLTIMLPRAIGQGIEVHEMDLDTIRGCIEKLRASSLALYQASPCTTTPPAVR